MTTPRAHTVPADPLIDEVRQRRRDLLALCGNDLGKLAELIRRREADHPERVIDPRTAKAKDHR
jgi:hypothetical protein